MVGGKQWFHGEEGPGGPLRRRAYDIASYPVLISSSSTVIQGSFRLVNRSSKTASAMEPQVITDYDRGD